MSVTKSISGKKFDFLICGAGLAGTTLAWTLHQAGFSIAISDVAGLSSASRLAPGVWNPVVFKRLTYSWKAEELLHFNEVFYPEIENKTQSSFYHPKGYNKILANKNETELWLKKAQENLFLGDIISLSISQPHPEIYQAGQVLQAGYVNTMQYLNAVHNFLQENDVVILPNRLDYEQIILHENHCSYLTHSFSKLIFCEGHLVKNNPYFKQLPFKPAKGETITINCPELKTDSILHKGISIIPIGNGHFRVGSTYNWEELDEIPGQNARKFLEDKFREFCPYPYTIIDHQAGVRPSTIDRRPVIGFHPVYPQLGIFNGLGTKGVMLAPFFAKQFTNFICGTEKLDPEASINRFKSYLI